MKNLLIALAISLISATGYAASDPVTFTWDAPTTYTDGSALSPSAISYYNLYWGTVSSSYTNTVSGIIGTTTTVSFPDNTNTIYAVVTAVVSTLGIDDSYSDYDGTTPTNLYYGDRTYRGQSFTSNGGVLDSDEWYLCKIGSPTGNAYSDIFNHSGTYGVSSVPTGTALATSSAVNVSTLSGCGTYTRQKFNFTSTNRITLSAAHYVTAVRYTGGDASNYIRIGTSTNSPTHSGNRVYFDGSIWYAEQTQDHPFFVTVLQDVESAYSNEVSKVLQYSYYTVTPSVSSNVTISSSIPQSVQAGHSIQFTITPASGYVATVGGTCGGSLVGTTYTTNIINSSCTVIVSAMALFVPNQYIQAESGYISGLSTGISVADTYVYATVNNSGYVSFPYSIAIGGSYKMRARINSNMSDGQNSFWVGLDNESAQNNDVYTYDTSLFSVFTWEDVSKRGNDTTATHAGDQYNPMIWALSAGIHTFTFYGRETGTQLDQIQLVSYATTTPNYTIIPVAGSHSYISPVSAQTVTSGLTTAFTITADAGYTAAGTGCNGALVGTTYTTGAINSACTVTASASANLNTIGGTVTGINSGTLILQNNGGNNKSITANGVYAFSTSIITGATYSVTVLTPPSGMSCIVSNSSGTVANANITNVKVDCYWTVNSSAGTGCNISPSGSTEVLGGTNRTYNITASSGYSVSSGSGTCGGNLIGGAYTINAATADCSVVANCILNTPTINGATFSLSSGSTQTFTIKNTGSKIIIQQIQ